MTEQLKALAEAAPKGEWTVVSHNWEFSSVYAGTGVIARCQAPFSMTDDDDDGESLEKAKDDIAAYIAAANPERILALIAENERLRGVLDEIATVNSLTATQPQFIRYLQNTAQAALCEGKDPDSCWNTRCNLGHKCRSALGETK